MPTHVLNNCFGVDSYVLFLCMGINKKQNSGRETGYHTYLPNITDKNNVHDRMDRYN